MVVANPVVPCHKNSHSCVHNEEREHTGDAQGCQPPSVCPQRPCRDGGPWAAFSRQHYRLLRRPCRHTPPPGHFPFVVTRGTRLETRWPEANVAVSVPSRHTGPNPMSARLRAYAMGLPWPTPRPTSLLGAGDQQHG